MYATSFASSKCSAIKSTLPGSPGRITKSATSPSFENYIIEKGSVCLDGISLTIAENKKNSFKVALIPHTLKITNWGRISIGDNVNIEVDMMAKYIENIMSKNK